MNYVPRATPPPAPIASPAPGPRSKRGGTFASRLKKDGEIKCKAGNPKKPVYPPRPSLSPDYPHHHPHQPHHHPHHPNRHSTIPYTEITTKTSVVPDADGRFRPVVQPSKVSQCKSYPKM